MEFNVGSLNIWPPDEWYTGNTLPRQWRIGSELDQELVDTVQPLKTAQPHQNSYHRIYNPIVRLTSWAVRVELTEAKRTKVSLHISVIWVDINHMNCYQLCKHKDFTYIGRREPVHRLTGPGLQGRTTRSGGDNLEWMIGIGYLAMAKRIPIRVVAGAPTCIPLGWNKDGRQVGRPDGVAWIGGSSA